MSDFDEEAERKRLREKYEQDEEQRKETQQMSELLLKGATMTNRHCDECGSPIFRYEGQEFCPTCQRTTGADGAAESEQGAGGSADVAETPSNPAAVESGETESGGTAEPPRTGTEPEPSGADPGSSEPGADVGAPAERQSVDAPSPPQQRRSGDPGATRSGSAPAADADTAATRATARESLLRALTRHAQLAEATDDARRAADHLAAAREAAEALDALDRS